MGSLKKITNRLYSEWKSSFNHNVEQIERAQKENKTSHKATNKRIDNLVLSSGGDSPNEVTDARTDTSGAIHDTLKARIDAGENLTTEEIKDLNEKLTNQREEISQLNGVIQELYGGGGSNVDLYVHADRGNDTTADGTEEKPFKTIQAATDGIPFLASSRFYIHVAPGVYLEDVQVRNNNVTAIEIVATNIEVIDAKEKDTGVFVRSILFRDCQAYCRIRGFTLTDAQNGPGFFTQIDRCSYGVVDKCRAAINTKNLDTSNFYWSDFRCYVWSATMGNTYRSLARNQDYVISSIYAGSLRVSDSVSGSGNNVVYSADGAIIFASGADLTGETKITTTYAGQVFEQ